jgi:hypothetical protein
MLEPAFARLEPVRNFTQRSRLGELAKKHRHQLGPATETPGVIFSLEFADMPGKNRALKQGKNLGKQTGGVSHFDLRG